MSEIQTSCTCGMVYPESSCQKYAMTAIKKRRTPAPLRYPFATEDNWVSRN